jgi:Domain of unknown function (DUF6456)
MIRDQSPSEVQQELERGARRLLQVLSEEHAVAERHDTHLRVMIRKNGVTMPRLELPIAVLAPLLSSGAVQCRSRAGRSVFTITPEGRDKLKRQQNGVDGFQRQHQEAKPHLVMRDGETEVALINEREDPLDWLRRHPSKGGTQISAAGFDAGERLRRDLFLAQAMPSVTTNWSRLAVDSSRNPDGLVLSERALAAKHRVERAFDAIDSSFVGLLIDICGFSKGLDLIEKERGWPARSAKLLLKCALDALAAHYGLIHCAKTTTNRLVHAWNDGDRAVIPASAVHMRAAATS